MSAQPIVVCVCVRASSQEANGGVPSLNPSRERSNGAIMQGGVASEKEAVLLGKYEQNKCAKAAKATDEAALVINVSNMNVG